MKHQVEIVLEDDHESLGRLLTELDLELARPDAARAFELLDLFWARLAVHIRAEHLHLFPALADAPVSLFTGSGSLPTLEEVHQALEHLHSDHDFFMKELARMMKIMRQPAVDQETQLEEIADLRVRLSVIAKRLEAHNRLEETQVYKWPALLFNQEELAALQARIAHEIANLPPRLVKGP